MLIPGGKQAPVCQSEREAGEDRDFYCLVLGGIKPPPLDRVV